MHRRLAVLLVAAAVSPAATSNAADFDLVIRNGRVVDGTGSAWRRADVGIRGDTVVAVARPLAGDATRVVDAKGRIVAPGFIDIHNHSRRAIYDVPTAENFVRQGVTTLIEGPDGSSPLPLREFFEKLAATRISVNMGAFVGQGSIREKVIGLADRKATAAEIDQMKAFVLEGMRDGAFGLSSGLFYLPGIFTPTDEVVALAQVAGEHGGIYISHMRNEADGLLDSVRETIAIGERGGLPTQLTHHKAVGMPNWGKSVETLRLVEEARRRGVDATIDQYPYTASSTALEVLLPAWSREGGDAATLKRLADPPTREKIRAAIVTSIKDDRGGGDPKNVQIASCAWDHTRDGKNLAQLTRERGVEPSFENAADTAMEMVEKGGASAIFHAIAEADLERILVSPNTMIASDGQVVRFGEAAPHPRSYGTFPRVLGRYVREKKLLALEDGVRKMTALPAQRLGLLDRGVLRPGLKADVTVFDADTIADTATFEKPHQYAVGVALVVVNGEVVLDENGMSAARPGRVLRGPAFAGR